MNATWQRATDLALRYQAGDEAAFAELLQVVGPALRAWLRPWYMQSYRGADRADLMQEALVATWQAALNYNPLLGPFGPWLRKCVERRLAGYVRVQTKRGHGPVCESLDGILALTKTRSRDGRRWRQAFVDIRTPEQIVMERETEREVVRLIDTVLPPQQCRVFRLWFATYMHGGYGDQAGIARVVGRSVKTVDSAVLRAKRRLREALKTAL